MLIKVIKDWRYPSGVNLFNQTPNNDGVWGNFIFTEEDVAECDYLIVLQNPPYDISAKCRVGGAWLINQEPPISKNKYFKKAFKYFDHVFSYYEDQEVRTESIQPVLPWYLYKDYKFLSEYSLSEAQNKSKSIVWITSNQKKFAGQITRMKLMEYLLDSRYPIEIYGNGINPIEDKFDVLSQSKYSLAIENFSRRDYWTEKIADSFLCWNLPFYWGATNIEKFFPKDSFIRLDIENPKVAVSQIDQAIKDHEWEKRLGAIEQARNLILNEYQFFPYITKLIESDPSFKVGKKKQYFVPANPIPKYIVWRDQSKYYMNKITSVLSNPILLKTVANKFLMKSDVKRWKNSENIKKGWEERTLVLSKMISRDDKSVLEFGAAHEKLRSCLPEECVYTPSDIVKRSNNTIVLNLNSDNVEKLGCYSVFFFSGVLEYVFNIDQLIKKLRERCNGIVLSYAVTDFPQQKSISYRRTQGWVNDYSDEDIVNLFEKNGFSCVQRNEWKRQNLYRFNRDSA